MIGAYSICHMDGDWLSWNIQRMYDYIDRFSVCVGPVRKYMGAEEDAESVRLLESIPDPEHKISITSGVWEDKNEMCRVAVAALKTDCILQLDADEVWPEKALEEAVSLLKAGKRKLRVHMYTFWKSARHVMETVDSMSWIVKAMKCRRDTMESFLRGDSLAAMELRGETGMTTAIDREMFDSLMRAVGLKGHLIQDKRFFLVRVFTEKRQIIQDLCYGFPWTPWLFDMYRAFRPCPYTRICHIPPDLQWPNGEAAHWYAEKTVATPIWHFSYIGKKRYERKARFFAGRAGQDVVPHAAFFNAWSEDHEGADMLMTGQLRRARPYDGPEIPADVQEFVEYMEGNG